jgi:hypothetical protein
MAKDVGLRHQPVRAGQVLLYSICWGIEKVCWLSSSSEGGVALAAAAVMGSIAPPGVAATTLGIEWLQHC